MIKSNPPFIESLKAMCVGNTDESVVKACLANDNREDMDATGALAATTVLHLQPNQYGNVSKIIFDKGVNYITHSGNEIRYYGQIYL